MHGPHRSTSSAPSTYDTDASAPPPEITTAVCGWPHDTSSARDACASGTPTSSGSPEPSSLARPKKSEPNWADTPLTSGVTCRLPTGDESPSSTVLIDAPPDAKRYSR